MMRSTRLTGVSLIVLVLALATPLHAKDPGVENLRQTGKAFAAVARQVSPSVVFIQVESKMASPATPFFTPFGDEFFRRFFGEPAPGLPRVPRHQQPSPERHITGQGSGFVFQVDAGSDIAYILTNNHVVENADKIRVQFKNGREYEAKITGRDPQSDIAVIEVRAKGLPALRLADSSRLEVGEWVVALGNPFGLSHTLTVGVVSAKGRTSIGINDYEDFIQTDAAINPGNSGGPLVNLEGEVVGINTAIFSRSGGYMGVGFAIPSNLVGAIAGQLIERGEVTRGYLGVVIQQLTSDLAESFGVEPGSGILVAQVTENSPAEKAGLRQGDLILRLNQEPVRDVGNFRNRVALTAPGDSLALTVLRDGKQQVVDITIGKLDGGRLTSAAPTQGADQIGIQVQSITPELAGRLGVQAGEGVLVSEVRPGSVAALAGIQPGMVILQVNRHPVNSAEEFKEMLRRGSQDRAVLLLLRQGNTQRYLVLRW